MRTPAIQTFDLSARYAKCGCALIAIAACVTFTTRALAEDLFVDPTRPAFARSTSVGKAAKPTPPPLRLTAIIGTDERRVAVLDGRVVQAGDRVGDATIAAVMEDGVRLQQGARETILRLTPQAISVRKAVKAASTQDSQEAVHVAGVHEETTP